MTDGRSIHQGFIGIQALHHEKDTLEVREVTKLHYCDLTSSKDEFSSYAQSIKLISTPSTTHALTNDTLDIYSEETTLSKFIHEGRPSTTKRLSLLFHLSPASNTAPIWHPQRRKLHQRLPEIQASKRGLKIHLKI